MYLVDTNVISEMRKLRSGRIDANVEAWSRSVRESELHISVITIYELQLGLLSIERRDHRQADILRTWIEDVVRTSFATRTLAVTAEIAATGAKLCIPDRRPLIDALIAATALVHGMTVATRNVADFAGTGVALLNPWHGGA